ncbi:AraC-like DNA-binding protein [Lewinella marina]|uniref:AraC family transcriptional regulator n=1 Tax=Neolewinella marina TaxID=438751 RepID=A0A2G0CK55_9BACT|nr:helix-turn-helix domain-containing protein [Neolewinella marina]NJB84466.1 AraC-like DNA-binding protein [Neolewinella marina]PHL00342.1 AraC family transcriptional regulator [Neolewinella marina]
MEEVLIFETIKQYCAFNNQETQHPLVAMIDLSRADPRKLRRMCFEFYVVFLKEVKCGDLRYGCNTYDYDEGTLVFLAPGQVIGHNGDEYYQPQGRALVFHPDFLPGSPLAQRMPQYTFFSYESNEALHLSSRERELIEDCLGKIATELDQLIDQHTRQLLLTNIELLLNYCTRFYDRQFITRTTANQGVLTRFEGLLNDYFRSGQAESEGLPTVNYFAERLHLSANYFGDLIKRETGKSPQDHIQLKVISLAKERLFEPGKSISEVAYDLGFKYPQHFSRMFKKVTGQTPNAYRNVN